MNTQTFANPSMGLVLGRAFAGTMAGIARFGRATWDWLGYLGQQRARAELLRMADAHATTQPALAARLRAAARGNWIGEG